MYKIVGGYIYDTIGRRLGYADNNHVVLFQQYKEQLERNVRLEANNKLLQGKLDKINEILMPT